MVNTKVEGSVFAVFLSFIANKKASLQNWIFEKVEDPQYSLCILWNLDFENYKEYKMKNIKNNAIFARKLKIDY